MSPNAALDLCRQHPRRLRRNTIRTTPRPTRPMPRPTSRRSRRRSRRSGRSSRRSRRERRWLVSSEGAFSYLARDFGLKELYLWPINADQQGTPQQVRKVIDAVRANKIPVVFSESTISPDPAKQVARETGAKYGGVLYVDSLSDADGPVPTYIDLLRVTSETIAKGLASERDDRSVPQSRVLGCGIADSPSETRPSPTATVTPRLRDATLQDPGRHDHGARRGQRQRQVDPVQGDHGLRAGLAGGEISILGQPVDARAEEERRRLCAAERGGRLELPRSGRGRGDDGPLWPHGHVAHRRSRGSRGGRQRRLPASA